ncbi:MAG: OmpA family protein [Acidobacteriaceae bacterium]|nr:OmpA family protein [Acidobacteriaceae bacterium]
MKKSKRGLLWTGIVPLILVLATSGCATKSFVRDQVAATNAKVSAVEAKVNDNATKEQTDVSRLQEQITTTDNKVAEVDKSAKQANTTATQANQLAQQNQTAIANNSTAIDTLGKAMNYTLVAKGDVTFGFNKFELKDADRAALDVLVAKVQNKPRPLFELVGFTDKVGSTDYNLTLSRRRADAVARYLVKQGVPLRGIHVIGLGKEPPPPSLVADLEVVNPNPTRAEAQRLARRVLIRVYTAEASPSSAGGSASLN